MDETEIRLTEEARAALSWLGRRGAKASWANTDDRAARTAPGRAAFDARFLEQADGDPVRAAELRTLHFQELARRSAAVRRAKKKKVDDSIKQQTKVTDRLAGTVHDLAQAVHDLDAEIKQMGVHVRKGARDGSKAAARD